MVPAVHARAEVPELSVEPSLWQRAAGGLKSTWQSDRTELYIPLYTWHNRSKYSAEKIAGYNENPWGLGGGKSRVDADGNWHALYAMVFMDSHNRLEPIAGYAYQKIWRPTENWRIGAGVTAGVTARSDYRYLPLPVVLPIASLEYKRVALQGTYIPGGNGNGNVLFTWLRWRF
jgi:palmitoyl transferase